MLRFKQWAWASDEFGASLLDYCYRSASRRLTHLRRVHLRGDPARLSRQVIDGLNVTGAPRTA